jgi:hypothetical protein
VKAAADVLPGMCHLRDAQAYVKATACTTYLASPPCLPTYLPVCLPACAPPPITLHTLHTNRRQQVDKKTVLENLDLVLLVMDEVVDGGCALGSITWSMA